MIDHLVYATPALEIALGIPLSPGGRHVGLGTRNLLADLGGGTYLEVVGPDPDQPDPAEPRPFGIDTLTEPRLVAWAVRVTDIDKVVAETKARGHDPGPVIPMSRRRPDGVLLEWRLTLPLDDGLLPFLIDWGTTPHPSEDAVHGSVLQSFRVTGDVHKGLEALGVDVPVDSGPPGLVAVISTPDGEVTLR
ncbi:VOC family protein [Actinocrispum wychmicini]|uniref:Glyoxalase-like protein n=1 Tax=Actinocrispum wychmicini TaxID=1213861 RepID=A0A4R2IGB0_9PSEU|nr:VOC family protein [Actinocrispum wychmicini]TCO43763.1 glyoxalase-like protein [Actinocrispum wychmicini]